MVSDGHLEVISQSFLLPIAHNGSTPGIVGLRHLDGHGTQYHILLLANKARGVTVRHGMHVYSIGMPPLEADGLCMLRLIQPGGGFNGVASGKSPD